MAVLVGHLEQGAAWTGPSLSPCMPHMLPLARACSWLAFLIKPASLRALGREAVFAEPVMLLAPTLFAAGSPLASLTPAAGSWHSLLWI